MLFCLLLHIAVGYLNLDDSHVAVESSIKYTALHFYINLKQGKITQRVTLLYYCVCIYICTYYWIIQ